MWPNDVVSNVTQWCGQYWCVIVCCDQWCEVMSCAVIACVVALSHTHTLDCLHTHTHTLDCSLSHTLTHTLTWLLILIYFLSCTLVLYFAYDSVCLTTCLFTTTSRSSIFLTLSQSRTLMHLPWGGVRSLAHSHIVVCHLHFLLTHLLSYLLSCSLIHTYNVVYYLHFCSRTYSRTYSHIH